MAGVRVSVLGPVRVEADGIPVPLTPLTRRLLVRLVAADGEAVPVRQLRRDVWGREADFPGQGARGRNEVQKRVVELRRAIGGGDLASGARVLHTEQLPTARGPETAYRLNLAPAELDCARFAELVNESFQVGPVMAAWRLEEALGMVRGRPLAEAVGEAFAEPLIRRLTGLQDTARRELISCRVRLGRPELALPVAEAAVRERPDDPSWASELGRLRAGLRGRWDNELLRTALPDRAIEIVVVCGDLFDQEDANLVAGFTDTFDTEIDQDLVISCSSVQGQLVERLFDGRCDLLDAELERALRPVPVVDRERSRDKPRGRRLRYPIGTTVAVPIGRRQVFATAYSRLDNDMVARSCPEYLAVALDRLWAAVARQGRYRPVAVPMLGSGLARIVDLDRGRLARLIVESFVRACLDGTPVAPELRLVVHPDDLRRTDLLELERFLQEAPHRRG
ncbi:macro domain-containing protein [Kitasatospora sp. NPDC059327]|uniref:macro domain-containing protein n=1 Tax=Kitasatospora sp. NPDC059327 TaxID=3346803 RepID=UPI0036CE10D1